MSELYGFPPLASRASRVLILGSMPGVASLQAQQYYAHPQNLFWPFMKELFSVSCELTYAQRSRQLVACGIAVWDVIAACERSGSLDSDIRHETVNDFAAFFKNHKAIAAIFLNGKKAEASFRKYVMPALGDQLEDKVLITLPSTSPAHASKSRAEKLKAWSKITEILHP